MGNELSLSGTPTLIVQPAADASKIKATSATQSDSDLMKYGTTLEYNAHSVDDLSFSSRSPETPPSTPLTILSLLSEHSESESRRNRSRRNSTLSDQTGTRTKSKRKKRSSKSAHKVKHQQMKSRSASDLTESSSICRHKNLRPSRSKRRSLSRKLSMKAPLRADSDDDDSSPAPPLLIVNSIDNGDEFEKRLRRGKSSDHEHDQHHLSVQGNYVDAHTENIWNACFDGKCDDIEHCVAVNRMVFALKWFDNAKGDADCLWNKIQEKQYQRHLVGDYQHVMNVHLNPVDAEQMQIERMLICQQILTMLSETKCDAALCLGYKRRQRQQCTQQSDAVHVPFYVQCIDKLHCYFMHRDV